MKIKKLKKIGTNRYQIELEGKTIKTYDRIMLKYQIFLKKELSDELLEKIEIETEEAAIYEKVLQFVNQKRRSAKEVEKFLKKQLIEEEKQREIINQLQDQGLLNQKEYIEAYVHDRFHFSSEGPHKIREDLLHENFDLDEINSVVEKIDESETRIKLAKLISKKITSNRNCSELYLKQKIMEQMIRLGYCKDMIQDLLDQESIDHTTILEQTAKKLFDKYKSKKKGSELRLMIKQKLYQKGYSLEEITSVLGVLEEKVRD